MKLSKNTFSKNIIFIIFTIVIISISYLFYKKNYNKEHYSNGILDLLQYNGEPIKYNIN